jgi:hypothetical protein
MNVIDEIKNELNQLAPTLADASRQMPFGVPEGFFMQFPEAMLKVAQSDPSYNVPAGYFDHFAESMLQKVRRLAISEELDQIAPTLNGIDKSMPYSLPEGYFSGWKPILHATQTHSAKVVKMVDRNWKQWVAAAAILITIGIGWQFLVNKPSDDAMVASTVTDAAMDTLLTKVDESSLTGYLEAEQAHSEFAGLLMLSQQDMETSVKQLSDDDLKWYLENQAVDMPGI